MEPIDADMGVVTVSVTFSATSSDEGRRSFSRMLPKTGRAARGFMKSSNSLSLSAMGLHLDAPRPGWPGRDTISLRDAGRRMMGVSSKLTRALFFRFSGPASDPASDVSLEALWLVSRPLDATGEWLRLETDGDDFKADFAGDTERASGSCFAPVSSTTPGAK